MTQRLAIHWFRQDLRLADNPALTAAANSAGREGVVLAVYVLDDASASEDAPGGASRLWLHHSLLALHESLGGRLAVLRGRADEVIPALARQTGARSVHWSRCYESWQAARDGRVEAALKAAGVEAESDNGTLLWEPWQVRKADGSPYRVFTPFYRKGCLNAEAPRAPLPAPRNVRWADLGEAIAGAGAAQAEASAADEAGVESLGLLTGRAWEGRVLKAGGWQPGEAGAQASLKRFLADGLHGYATGRDFPAAGRASRLSPHLRFGELSPNQAWHGARSPKGPEAADLEKFLAQLAWREFSYTLLHDFPELPRRNLQPRFDAFPWQDDPARLRAWQEGRTGYPIIDAAMRELRSTGYMHNRLRMAAGSFLVKNLLLDWRLGAAWFWDNLLDADLANNSASWQWIAGCGADAAPYFRVFNPVLQGRRFDAEGAYTRRFVPELARVAGKHLFAPWEAPEEALREAGVRLGADYPHPIVDAALSRKAALAAFAELRATSGARGTSEES